MELKGNYKQLLSVLMSDFRGDGHYILHVDSQDIQWIGRTSRFDEPVKAFHLPSNMSMGEAHECLQEMKRVDVEDLPETVELSYEGQWCYPQDGMVVIPAFQI